MSKVAISAVVIAKNEADRLGETLKSLQFCNEIIVVDSFSTDNTMDVAKSNNAQVYQQTFLGYGAQKNYGFSKAKNNWVFSVDADEVVTNELIKEIQDTFNKEIKDCIAFYLPRKHVFLGKLFKYGKESKDMLPRLFNKNYAQYDDALVHEKLIINGATKTLKNSLLHNTYRNWEHAVAKMDNYSKLGAKALRAKHKKRPLWLAYVSYPFYFFKHYFIYLNVLNGREGLQWSLLVANYHFKKYLYLYKA